MHGKGFHLLKAAGVYKQLRQLEFHFQADLYANSKSDYFGLSPFSFDGVVGFVFKPGFVIIQSVFQVGGPCKNKNKRKYLPDRWTINYQQPLFH